MPLVEYSSSEEDPVCDPSRTKVGTSRDISKKRKRNETELVKQTLPPLPAEFHTLFVTAPRTHPSDDPVLHRGRSRQVPHVEGNWPTHIYLEWYPPRTELELLQKIVNQANTNGQVLSLLQSKLGAQLPLHISLSAPLVLKAGQKTDFEATVLSKILESGVGPFQVSIQRLRWERNFDGTRWFLVLGVSTLANDELDRLLQACNDCAVDFELPLLYSKRKAALQEKFDAFHISIAWQLTEPSLKQTQVQFDVSELGNLQFETIKLKMGNVVKDILFRKR